MKTLLPLAGVEVALAISLAFVLIWSAAPEKGGATHILPTVGIDAVPTGNTANFVVSVEDCALVDLNSTTTVDIFVQDIPDAIPGDPVHHVAGLSTFFGSFLYDPTKVQVVDVQMEDLFMSEPLFITHNSLPDSDGEFNFVILDLSSPENPSQFSSGSGVVARLTLEGLVIGTASLHLQGVQMYDGDLDFLTPDPLWAFLLSAEAAVGSTGNCNDADGDGICDPGRTGTPTNPCTGTDNCPFVFNPTQADMDGDGIADACDADAEADGIEGVIDGFMLSGVFQDESMVFSSSFTDEDLGGTTFGQILDGQPLILVTEEPNPDGVLITAINTGNVNGCDFGSLGFSPGDSVVLTCITGGFSVDTISGPVSALFDGILMDLPSSTLVTVEEMATDVFLISNDASSSADVTVEQTQIPPGSSLIVCTGSNDCDSDGVPDDVDNCRIVPNGPLQAGVPGIGNQTNTDADLFVAGYRLGLGSPPPLILPDSLGDACDPDDDNDLFSDQLERSIYLVSPGSVQERTPCRTDNVVDDPWPPDLPISGLPDRVVDISDLGAIVNNLFLPSAGNERFNLYPDGAIDISDLMAQIAFLFFNCQPSP